MGGCLSSPWLGGDGILYELAPQDDPLFSAAAAMDATRYSVLFLQRPGSEPGLSDIYIRDNCSADGKTPLHYEIPRGSNSMIFRNKWSLGSQSEKIVSLVPDPMYPSGAVPSDSPFFICIEDLRSLQLCLPPKAQPPSKRD